MGCHFCLQGNLPDPGTEPVSLALQVDSLPLSNQGRPVGSTYTQEEKKSPFVEPPVGWLDLCTLSLASDHTAKKQQGQVFTRGSQTSKSTLLTFCVTANFQVRKIKTALGIQRDAACGFAHALPSFLNVVPLSSHAWITLILQNTA